MPLFLSAPSFCIQKAKTLFYKNADTLLWPRKIHRQMNFIKVGNADIFVRNIILSAPWKCRYFCRVIHFFGKQRNHFLWKMPIFHQNLTTFVGIWRNYFEENADSFFTNFILSASCRYFVGPFLNSLWKNPISYRDLTMNAFSDVG